jgi:WD40 repeat protein
MVVLRGHDGEVESAEFNRAGDRVVSAGADGTVRIWDPRGGGSLVTIQRHAGPARSASFTPDGAAVLSSGDDGLAQLSACEVCGSLAQVSQLASARATQRPRPVAGP